MRSIKRQPLKIGGRSFAFVARDYPTTIINRAKKLKDRGYFYRIFVDGKQRLLYVGPKRKRTRVKKRLKR